jgi:hypothetical protein
MKLILHRSDDKKKGEIQYGFCQTGNHTVEIRTDEGFIES